MTAVIAVKSCKRINTLADLYIFVSARPCPIDAMQCIHSFDCLLYSSWNRLQVAKRVHVGPPGDLQCKMMKLLIGVPKSLLTSPVYLTDFWVKASLQLLGTIVFHTCLVMDLTGLSAQELTAGMQAQAPIKPRGFALSLIVILVILLFLDTIAIGLRVYCKAWLLRKNKVWGLDDTLAVLGFVSLPRMNRRRTLY